MSRRKRELSLCNSVREPLQQVQQQTFSRQLIGSRWQLPLCPARCSIDQPGETHLADKKRAASETLISHYFYFAFIYFIAPSCTDKLFCFSTNFKRSLRLCGQRAMETAVEIGWITKHSLCARAFCLSSVFLASGSDRARFTKRILLPEQGFLKFIVHSITLYEP